MTIGSRRVAPGAEGESAAYELIKRFDYNHDGVLSVSERNALAAELAKTGLLSHAETSEEAEVNEPDKRASAAF